MLAADMVTFSAGITQAGYAMDARHANASVEGSLAQKVDANKSSIQSVNTSLTGKISTALDVLHRFTQDSGYTNQCSGNLNDIKVTSIYNCSHQNVTNYPSKWDAGQWSFIITLVHVYSASYCTQIAVLMNASNAQRIATRYKLNNIWNDWAYITVGQ